MGLGSVVKYYRLKAGMTQNELCREICSVSHLSKIENDSYEGNDETLTLLLERLGIQLEEEKEKLANLEEDLFELLDAIRFTDTEKINSISKIILQQKDYCTNSKLLFLYQVVMMWYYNFIGDTENALNIEEHLERLSKNMNNVERCLYVIGVARNLIKTNEPLKSLKYLEENSSYIFSTYEHDYIFQLGYSCSIINNPERAITYMNKCIPYFQEELNIMKLISSRIIVAISYLRIGLLEEASHIYKHVLRNLRMLGKHDLYYQTLYNYGLVLLEKKQYDEAYAKFEKVTRSVEPNDTTFILSKLSIINIYLSTGKDRNITLMEIEQILENPNIPVLFKMHAQRYKNKLTLSEAKFYSYLENKYLPFLHEMKIFDEVKMVELDIARHFELLDPQKSISYYKNYL